MIGKTKVSVVIPPPVLTLQFTSQSTGHREGHIHTDTRTQTHGHHGLQCVDERVGEMGVLLPHSTQTTSTAGCSLPERQRPGPSTEIILITIITFFSPLNRFQKNGTVH